MENLTHSLVGATLAELALPSGAPSSRRRLFLLAGIVAANLPDADLLYTRITPPPLGYLLHHRGHTHTLGGLAAQALLVGVVCMLPALRRAAGAAGVRLGALVVAALLSHLVLDSWNSYGVHPFWPFDARWRYGDAIFIAEPWLWLFLGAMATLNAQGQRARWALGLGLALLVGIVAALRFIPVGAVIALAATAGVIAALARSWAPHRRALVALSLTALFVATMFGVRSHAHAKVLRAANAATHGEIVDVVLNPQPANPLCWEALAIGTDEARGEYMLSQASVAVAGTAGCGPDRGSDVQWGAPRRQSLARLRELDRLDCSVRAWLQFGRAPELGAGTIADLRYGRGDRENFSTMPLSPVERASVCPPNLTAWGRPREDLLRR